MIGSTTHSRAAVLCFGGWGLQVMLHLAPRLRAAQEQRTVLGSTSPDLNQTTSFGVVNADPYLTGDGQTQFQLHSLRADRSLSPFYVERLLADYERNPPAATGERSRRLLTVAEQRASYLFHATESFLEPLAFDGHDFRSPASGVDSLNKSKTPADRGLRRATRSDIFKTALTHADPASRLLETFVFDPIRQDNLAPDDPFVQTTLYVIAPLFEPLTSALVWPLVSGLMQRLGRRHISHLVAVFATGSYASDLTRSVEDASAYAALAELEVLTGLRRNDTGCRALAVHINGANPLLAEQVGEPLFDHLYLLDREKSNQGLAEDSHEIAVLAGNALEALIVGSGDLYIQEQLGYALRSGDQRPYSLLGAAADYVPLQQILYAVNRQEESRLVRDWVLRSTPDESQKVPLHPLARLRGSQNSYPTLAELGFTQPRSLQQLALRMPDLFANPEPKEIRDLAVRQSFVFPPAAAADLRRLPAQDRPEAFDGHLDQVQHTLDLAAGPAGMDEAWGLAIAGADTGLAFAAGLEADDRLVPQLLTRMHKRLLDLLSASPAGLTLATNQSQRWLHETQEALQKLQVSSTPSTRQLNQIQSDLSLRDWATGYTDMLAKTPTFASILARATAAVSLVAVLAFAYLQLVGRTWNQVEDGLALAGFAAGIYLVGIGTYRYILARQRRFRRKRVELAELELTNHLQAEAHAGLVRVYGRLADVLRNWNGMLHEAMEELHALSTPPEMPAVPPKDVHQSYLNVPHMNQELWDRCLAFLRTHLDADGQRSEERLDLLWGQARWRHQMERILRTVPVGSASGAGSRSGRSQAHTIAKFIRHTVHESVAPVSIEDPTPVRADLLRSLATEFSIEQLLWRGAVDAGEMKARLRAMGVEDFESADELPPLSNRRYVETSWNRAKPTANYDVADRLAVYGITIDFAAASGKPDSELTRALLDEFNITLLPTENPFAIIFVRTVHGLSLDDLDSIRRYRLELRYLSPQQRHLILLNTGASDELYGIHPLTSIDVESVLNGTTETG